MPRLALALLLIGLAACGAPADATTFRAGDVRVIDESGLVTAAEPYQPPVDQLGEPTAVPGESLTQVLVSWAGSSCVQDWTVRLTGNALVMTIEPGTSITGCEGMAAARGVQLDLRAVVDATDIDVSLAGS